MSKKLILVTGAVFLVFALSLFAQEQPSQQDQQKMMEAYKKMGALNENHEYLKYFVGEWDVTSRAFFLSTGSRDESGKVITDTGEWPDPMTGGMIKVRAVNTLVNKDEFTYELYMTGPDGKEFKSLENRARRKQQK